jgi:hypothetical protein
MEQMWGLRINLLMLILEFVVVGAFNQAPLLTPVCTYMQHFCPAFFFLFFFFFFFLAWFRCRAFQDQRPDSTNMQNNDLHGLPRVYELKDVAELFTSLLSAAVV